MSGRRSFAPLANASLRRHWSLTIAPLVIAPTLLALSACSESAPPPAPVPTTPPPPPPEPEVIEPTIIELEEVLESMDLDPRVQTREDLAVPDNALEFARSSLRLADALARGDADTMRELLERDARAVLSDLVATGDWDNQTRSIEIVRVTDIAAGAEQLTLAVQDADGAYLLAWQARASGDAFAWKGVPTDDIRERFASDFENVSAAVSSTLPVSDLNLYVRLQVNERAAQSVGIPIDAEVTLQAVAVQLGSSGPAVRAAFARGVQEAQTDASLSAEEVHAIVNEYTAAFAALGHDIQTSDFVTWIAEALGEQASDINALYDEGEKNASS
ncbi:MAG: hypothetical protein AAGK04_04175 [Planctomycetota bacterium]